MLPALRALKIYSVLCLIKYHFFQDKLPHKYKIFHHLREKWLLKLHDCSPKISHIIEIHFHEIYFT